MFLLYISSLQNQKQEKGENSSLVFVELKPHEKSFFKPENYIFEIKFKS